METEFAVLEVSKPKDLYTKEVTLAVDLDPIQVIQVGSGSDPARSGSRIPDPDPSVTPLGSSSHFYSNSCVIHSKKCNFTLH